MPDATWGQQRREIADLKMQIHIAEQTIERLEAEALAVLAFEHEMMGTEFEVQEGDA